MGSSGAAPWGGPSCASVSPPGTGRVQGGRCPLSGSAERKGPHCHCPGTVTRGRGAAMEKPAPHPFLTPHRGIGLGVPGQQGAPWVGTWGHWCWDSECEQGPECPHDAISCHALTSCCHPPAAVVSGDGIVGTQGTRGGPAPATAPTSVTFPQGGQVTRLGMGVWAGDTGGGHGVRALGTWAGAGNTLVATG